MARLYEEVRIRLEEMAMITARNLKMNSGWRRGGPVRPVRAGDGGRVRSSRAGPHLTRMRLL